MTARIQKTAEAELHHHSLPNKVSVTGASHSTTLCHWRQTPSGRSGRPTLMAFDGRDLALLQLWWIESGDSGALSLEFLTGGCLWRVSRRCFHRFSVTWARIGGVHAGPVSHARIPALTGHFGESMHTLDSPQSPSPKALVLMNRPGIWMASRTLESH